MKICDCCDREINGEGWEVGDSIYCSRLCKILNEAAKPAFNKFEEMEAKTCG